MPLSRAEIQRRYRERKKLADPNFLKKEAARIKEYYVRADDLPLQKRRKRNHANKLRNRLSRFNKQQRQENESPPFSPSSGYGTGTGAGGATDDDASESRDTPPRGKLIVKLPKIYEHPTPSCSGYKSRKADGPKKAKKRALARAHKQIASLENQNIELKKQLAVRNTQMHRLRQKRNATPKPDTPQKITESQLDELQLTPRRRSKARRQLLPGNVMLAQVASNKNKCKTKQRHLMHQIFSGDLVRKYRCVKTVSRATKLSRTSILKRCREEKAGIGLMKEGRMGKARRSQELVIKFMMREDNARMQPGKKDKVKADGENKQKLVLTDYLYNLHQKFLADYPNQTLCLRSFGRMRPKHIMLASFTSRNTCLCIKHQNMAFMIEAVRKSGVDLDRDPEKLPETAQLRQQVNKLTVASIKYKEWKKVKEDSGKQRTKLMEIENSATQFKESMLKSSEIFVEHVRILREQFHQMKKLKTTMTMTDIIIQMDFAENYVCREVNEVQSAYWNQTSVTIHPVVVHHRPEPDKMKTNSFALISDVKAHSAATVIAFVVAVIPQIRNLVPQVKTIHYWTDSPTSQYRNRFILDFVAHHSERFGINAVWNFFESGHGKSACDGVGGCLKRMADEAVKMEKVVIQDAQDFFKWANTALDGVQCVFVPSRACEEEQEQINGRETVIKPVPGTMKLHAATHDGRMKVKNTSCYCETCIRGEYCDNWRTVDSTRATIDGKPPEIETEHQATIEVGTVVAATYEDNHVEDWYIGEVVSVMEDDYYEVNFMTKAKSHFKWPQRRDVVPIHISDIICTCKPLIPSGKSARLFKLAVEDREKIEHNVSQDD